MKKRHLWCGICLLIVNGFLCEGQTRLHDAESALHGNEAANYQIVREYPFENCVLTQFKLGVLSHYSYILRSGDQALLIDPGRDIDYCVKYLAAHKLKLQAVLLTHSHADFVAGHMEALKTFNVPIYISHAANAGYKHRAIHENDTLNVGKVSIRFLETPGHTLDGICAIVSSGGKVQFLLTGDTLFVGSVGRPDLMGGTVSAAELAGKSYDSWHKKLSKLPDDLKFFPAHGAGSLCGAHLKDAPYSTIGQEKRDNSHLLAKSRSEFIAKVLDGLPEAPQYFKYNAELNRKGPSPVDWNAAISCDINWPHLTDPAKYCVLDVRDAKKYAAGHIPNSVNISLHGRFENWVGGMVAPDETIILAADTREELQQGVHRLHRIGYQAQGVLYSDVAKNRIVLHKSGLVKPAALYDKMQKGVAPMVVDVRLPNEWAGVRIGSIVNLPLTRLSELSGKLNRTEPVVTVCNSAYRSSLAVGILERCGFTDISSIDGGTEAWLNAGLPVFRGSEANATAPPGEKPARKLPIPDRISPNDLFLLTRDLPGSFELVDLRPLADFQEYTLPGARHADVSDVINGIAYRSSGIPLILIDRDGSVAMAVGGILSSESPRPIKVLHGGVEAYWQTFGNGQKTFTVPAAPSVENPKQPVSQPPSPPPPDSRPSAGC